jgi:hypothetical protein
MIRNFPANHPKVLEIVTRRQIALAEKLRQDELKHQRSLLPKMRMKVVV